ncbi:MAG: hypothetical protein RL101_460 [Actinomycetota bacterium]|jgi:uncharacterized protein YdhG (YjbR/CyaY superfamily)
MAKSDIDKIFASTEEPKRSTLEEMRRRILEIVPDAEQCIKYGMPTFQLDGKSFASVAPFKNHLNYSPHSGQIFKQIPDELKNYKYSTGSLQFPVDKPLPKSLIKKLIRLRLDEIDGK